MNDYNNKKFRVYEIRKSIKRIGEEGRHWTELMRNDLPKGLRRHYDYLRFKSRTNLSTVQIALKEANYKLSLIKLVNNKIDLENYKGRVLYNLFSQSRRYAEKATCLVVKKILKLYKCIPRPFHFKKLGFGPLYADLKKRGNGEMGMLKIALTGTNKNKDFNYHKRTLVSQLEKLLILARESDYNFCGARACDLLSAKPESETNTDGKCEIRQAGKKIILYKKMHIPKYVDLADIIDASYMIGEIRKKETELNIFRNLVEDYLETIGMDKFCKVKPVIHYDYQNLEKDLEKSGIYLPINGIIRKYPKNKESKRTNGKLEGALKDEYEIYKKNFGKRWINRRLDVKSIRKEMEERRRNGIK